MDTSYTDMLTTFYINKGQLIMGIKFIFWGFIIFSSFGCSGPNSKSHEKESEKSDLIGSKAEFDTFEVNGYTIKLNKANTINMGTLRDITVGFERGSQSCSGVKYVGKWERKHISIYLKVKDENILGNPALKRMAFNFYKKNPKAQTKYGVKWGLFDFDNEEDKEHAFVNVITSMDTQKSKSWEDLKINLDGAVVFNKFNISETEFQHDPTEFEFDLKFSHGELHGVIHGPLIENMGPCPN